MSITSNAGQVAGQLRRRAAVFSTAVHQALLALLVAVNRRQISYLSGAGSEKSGAYPIPVRTGNLRRSADWGFLDTHTGFVTAGGAAAPYAVALHEGLGTSGRHGRRPFQDDAVRDTDGMAILTGSLRESLA